mgnify:CR=1 FL=1
MGKWMDSAWPCLGRPWESLRNPETDRRFIRLGIPSGRIWPDWASMWTLRRMRMCWRTRRTRPSGTAPLELIRRWWHPWPGPLRKLCTITAYWLPTSISPGMGGRRRIPIRDMPMCTRHWRSCGRRSWFPFRTDATGGVDFIMVSHISGPGGHSQQRAGHSVRKSGGGFAEGGNGI